MAPLPIVNVMGSAACPIVGSEPGGVIFTGTNAGGHTLGSEVAAGYTDRRATAGPQKALALSPPTKV